jgi:hypothetical protein
MIRRELMFADNVKHWLIISQVEHARLSGWLAERCLDQFGGGRCPDAVRQELLGAISHHDDGWHEWEQSPRIDREHGRPIEEAISIWDRSIRAAYEIGYLAAWTVAGHFSALLATLSDHAEEAVARRWLREVAHERSQWFSAWHSRDEATHTAELAGEALRWVQLFDLLSLWPCSQYPIAGEQVPRLPKPFRTGQTLVSEIRPSMRQSPNQPCRIVFEPWPFDEKEFALQAAGHLVVAQAYSSPTELLAAREPFVAEWGVTGEW